jgi:hypothetical protein
VKFIFADSLDVVDPRYNFEEDVHHPNRRSQWDDRYPHEIMNPPPYDGVLVSRGIVGDHLFPGKYTPAQAMRFRRLGARRFLRLDQPQFAHMPIFGDSGAFSYAEETRPPYTPAQVLEFYVDAGFTHGCSVDHVIFDFEREENGRKAVGSEKARLRSEITLQNAKEFLSLSADLGPSFTPIGVVQGWSPSSIADAAGRLEKMGYSYIAIGGLVPLRSADIHLCLDAVRKKIKESTQIHLLGFAKAEQIQEFARHHIASFDSTSPLIRAFKDARSNYYVLGRDGLEYYAAVRIPQALENAKLKRAAKEGRLNQEYLVALERKALDAVRGYDRGKVSLETAAQATAEYGCLLEGSRERIPENQETARMEIYNSVLRTLRDQPWKKCACEICRAASVEVVIFRSSNRNKRRGFHNLGVFFAHLQRLFGKDLNSEDFQVPRGSGAPKC